MLPFTKMHGAGNDFVCLEKDAVATHDLGLLAREMCDRRRGVGADGMIVIGPAESGLPEGGAVSMRMFNADGTESSMCGNGLRCVAKYAVEHGLVRTDHRLLVQTGAGVMAATCHSGAHGIESVTVDMGPPNLSLDAVGVDADQLGGGDGPDYPVTAKGLHYAAVFVSMGNPHATIFVDDVGAVDLASVGPELERHKAFSERMNVHFVEVSGPGEIIMRTWERGSGITGACGSGACAVCVAGAVTGRTQRKLLAHLPGGDLEVEWNEQADHVMMTGGAVELFSGQWKATG